jgi:hypothetical protein
MLHRPTELSGDNSKGAIARALMIQNIPADEPPAT